MGSNFPALDIKQPDSPLQQYGQYTQLKALQGQIAMQPGQLQLQQQQIEAQKRQLDDASARTAALREWSQNPGSMKADALPDLILKHGGSADAYTEMQQKLISQQTQLATLDKDKLDNMNKRVSAEAAASQSVLSLAPALQPAAWALKQKELVANGVIKPEDVQPFDPDVVKLHAAAGLSVKDQLDTALKARETAAAELTAQAKQTAANKPPAEVTDVADYTKDYLAGKNLADTASNRLLARQQYYKDKQPFGAQKIQIEQQRANTSETTAENNASRKDIDFIDKNYVKPANDKEQSYQMFQEAYNNRNNAKTGAESMLALSTHLATTFGNVKGSRVTKDMIEHHLGARSISDSALVATQKLTNGDVLSKDQWDAFKGLISNSRNLTWQTAQKEATRRGVDISGSLPADMQGKPNQGGGNEIHYKIVDGKLVAQ